MVGQAVVITGALTGIGRATAFAFAREGARMVISGRRKDAGVQLANDLQELGAEAEFVLADVRHEDDLRRLVDRAVERFGRLDAAVNNAGTDGQRRAMTDHTAETLAATFDTNVTGVLLAMKHELRVMLPQGHGSIINVSSIFGLIGAPGNSIYSASKHAVEGLTKSAALEVAASGVRINAVAPGAIATDMFNRYAGTEENKAGILRHLPTRRFGRPDEVAQTILFLASDKAPYITGHSVGVDGGRSAG